MASFSITSTGPRRFILSPSAAACDLYVGNEMAHAADPNPAFFGGGLFIATAEPTIVAATATVIRARIRNCWRHSRRNNRHAHRTTARRAGTPSSTGRLDTRSVRTRVLI